MPVRFQASSSAGDRVLRSIDQGSVKVLHIFGQMNRGGAEMRTLEIMRNLDRRRYHLQFCALSGKAGELDDEIRALGGEVHYISLGLRFPCEFRRLLELHEYDAIHSHVHYSSGLLLRLARSQQVPVRIAHFRSTTDGQVSSLRRKLQRKVLTSWIDRYATNILAVSQGTMSAAWPSYADDPRCQVIYNGLDLSSFVSLGSRDEVRSEFGLPHDCSLCIHVGTMDRAKNHVRLLSIFSELLMKRPSAILLLVGRRNAGIEPTLHQKVTELGLDDRVIFAGPRSDIPRLLNAADLMIFPSVFEGLPGAVLEACAAGIPVLASDLPGILEIAAYFPSVQYLSLSANDTEWARVAETLFANFNTVGDKTIASDAFRASPFQIQTSLEAHCCIWQGRNPGC